MTPTLMLIFMLLSSGLAWQAWRDLDQLKREVERHEQGQTIKRRVLGELARRAIRARVLGEANAVVWEVQS